MEGGWIELPENGQVRRVDLSVIPGEALRRLRTYRTDEALAREWGAVPEWGFVNEHGLPIWKSDFEPRVFHKALEKAGLRRIPRAARARRRAEVGESSEVVLGKTRQEVVHGATSAIPPCCIR